MSTSLSARTLIAAALVVGAGLLAFLLFRTRDVSVLDDGGSTKRHALTDAESKPVEHGTDAPARVRALGQPDQSELNPVDVEARRPSDGKETESADARSLDDVLAEARSRDPLTQAEMIHVVGRGEQMRASSVRELDSYRKWMNPQALDHLREEATRMERLVVVDEWLRAVRSGRYVVLTQSEGHDLSHRVKKPGITWHFVPFLRAGEPLVVLIPLDPDEIPSLRDLRARAKAIDAEIERLSRK